MRIRRFSLRQYLAITSVFLLIGYGLFNARNLILGPQIEIFSPTKTEVAESLLEVSGRVKNMVFLSLNERPISVDQTGLFEEKLLLYPGFNIIEIKARDRFKQEVTKKIEVYYKQK